MDLKEKLVALRKEKGLTQLAVAEKLDVSRQAISRWESGNALPSTENLRCLSELYSVPIDYLINNNGTKTIQSIRTEKSTTGGKRKKIILVCIVLVISVVVTILIVAAHKEVKKVDFETVGSEDWNDSETEDIPIQW